MRRNSSLLRATWWIQATAGVNYYRAEMPAKHLPGKTLMLNPSLDLTEPSPDVFSFPRQEGVAIWLFPGNTTRAILMAHMKNLGIPLIVEVDDNYTRQPSIPQLSSWLTTRDKTGEDRHSYEIHKRIVPWVDGIICSTPRLAEIYADFNDNIHVCRNSVDPDDWQPATHQEDGVLRIGWAGSWSHAYDVHDIEDAFDWAGRQKDVEVVTIGYQPPRMINQKNTDPSFNYRHIGWMDSVEDYRRAVGAIDVMLCPVRANPWADCKSDVKALEAAMGNAAVVVSKTEPYRPWWDGEAPGYVAERPKDYVKIIKHLIKNRDEVRESARLARFYALEHRNIHDTVDQWKRAIASVHNLTVVTA